MPTFEIIDTGAQIYRCKISWDDKGVYFNTAFNINVGALQAERIRRGFVGLFLTVS